MDPEHAISVVDRHLRADTGADVSPLYGVTCVAQTGHQRHHDLRYTAGTPALLTGMV